MINLIKKTDYRDLFEYCRRGPGIYGIEAAAFYYFQKSAWHLTLQPVEALVASLPNPYWRNPRRPIDNFYSFNPFY
ncbi:MULTISPECIES: transglycosylase domain-containing protein [unclassified Bartonella]|uniref:transglycosylase domain-containing protein n=1 Tax=unclassified Bartonella TaxID=2645622 RepID=UPI00099B015B